MACEQNEMLREVSDCRQADARLEPLTVGVDQGDERDRRLADVRREQGQVVERLLRLGVQDPVSVQGREPLGFTHVVVAR